MEAAPTVMLRSVAICGNSVSAARTMAWLAKLAMARNAMARVGVAVGGNGVDSIGVAGFLARNASQA